jgi:CRP/FNR family cyclic AMP-dependent transcriptional regulator
VERARLAAIPLFEGLPEHELDAVAHAASELEVAAGDALMSEGEFGHALFAIEAGSADVSVDGASVGAVGPGDVIGEIAVLASGRRTASVVATTPLRVIALFKRDVWALEQRAPEAARRLRSALETHLASR